MNDVFSGEKLDGNAVTRNTKQVKVYIASRSYPAVAPLLDTVDGAYLSGEGMRATFQNTAICADKINAALRDGTPLRTLVGPRAIDECRCAECGRLVRV